MTQVTQISSNFPVDLMIGLRDTFGLRQFIETGTSNGHTTQMAALAFPKVQTIEINQKQQEASRRKFRNQPHVTCHLGDTRDWIKTLDFAAMPPTLIYLDAHCAGSDYPEESQLPLAEELSAIGSLYGKHCIVIDDNSPEVMEPLIKHLGGFVFGVKQFCVVTPQPCAWQLWQLEVVP